MSDTKKRMIIKMGNYYIRNIDILDFRVDITSIKLVDTTNPFEAVQLRQDVANVIATALGAETCEIVLKIGDNKYV